ncbi:hypothetical protein LC55x_5500 [Lysobacter capsici]|nr:hypothetical protein LC55x_5500 [Lysobacter capsici]
MAESRSRRGRLRCHRPTSALIDPVSSFRDLGTSPGDRVR